MSNMGVQKYADMATIRDPELFQSELRDFSSWMNGAVPGASDVDCIIERHGNFVVLEHKPWFHDGVTVPYGQHLMLLALSHLEPFTVILVGEDKATGLVHYLQYGTQDWNYQRTSNSIRYTVEQFTVTTKDELSDRIRKWDAQALTTPKPRYPRPPRTPEQRVPDE